MSDDVTGREASGWVKPRHDCMDTLNHDPRRKDDHAGTVWRCECGKAWRVHGFLTWRLRRYDAKTPPAARETVEVSLADLRLVLDYLDPHEWPQVADAHARLRAAARE